ncbi:histidinol dehydrogenase [Flavobacterium psychrophilum]|nr:histidinol dehydrogenase [Flavobacterium psychrophilum]AOE54277.1 histidinol dehydrogenase [Flavobacterium psychrophilum]
MQKIINPPTEKWSEISQRPVLQSLELDDLVQQIFIEIKRNGDSTLKKYTKLFDGATIENIKVSEDEITESVNLVSDELKAAIQLAKANIEKFHTAQAENKQIIETTPGVNCWRESRPIEKIGIYIPGGSAPLFSTILMLGVPAQIAGCREIVLCTPPDKNGTINPAILYTAQLIGITTIYKVGGIQAIGAMVIGTESIDKVDKIFGPGNQYVTAAKQGALKYGVAIDLPAGPSELLVIADANANPDFVAADLLSQAEHGADSQVILLSDDETIIDKTIIAISAQVEELPRKEIALKALHNSKALLLADLKACVDFSNLYAPEHLIIACENTDDLTNNIINAGSVFIGNYSCESIGDYASGTNHTLPTNGFAKNYSGVSLDSFVKKITFQKVSAEGIKNIGPAVEIMAAAEQLEAHKNAVSIRLKAFEND